MEIKVWNTFIASTVFSLWNCPVVLKKERCMSWQSCFFPSWSLVVSQQDFLQWSSSLSSFPQQPLEPIAHIAEQRCIYTITVSSRNAVLFAMWFLIFIYGCKDTTINGEGKMMLLCCGFLCCPLCRKFATKNGVRLGKIKCEATEGWVLCAVGLPLFLFYRRDSQNGFADFRRCAVWS